MSQRTVLTLACDVRVSITGHLEFLLGFVDFFQASTVPKVFGKMLFPDFGGRLFLRMGTMVQTWLAGKWTILNFEDVFLNMWLSSQPWPELKSKWITIWGKLLWNFFRTIKQGNPYIILMWQLSWRCFLTSYFKKNTKSFGDFHGA